MADWKTTKVLAEVSKERQSQDARWGEQNHPVIGGDGGGNPLDLFRRSYLRQAEIMKAANADAEQSGCLGWDGILLEEVYEALSEADPDNREAELIQVAAVAVAMVECSRRNRGKQ